MKRKITKQEEAIDSTLLRMRQRAYDALISVNKLIDECDSDAFFESAEDLCSQAHDIYRLVVTLQTLEEMDNLTEKEHSHENT